MYTTCINSKNNPKSNDSDHIFVIRENTRLKHRCPLLDLALEDLFIRPWFKHEMFFFIFLS